MAGELLAARPALMRDPGFSYSPALRMRLHLAICFMMITASGTSAVQSGFNRQPDFNTHSCLTQLDLDPTDTLKCQKEEEALCTLLSYLHERSAELRLPSPQDLHKFWVLLHRL